MPLFSKKPQTQDLTGLGLEQLLLFADASNDPVQKYQALLLAEQKDPQSLPVQRRLLLLGRLFERNPRQADYTIIPCYLFHAFEHPEDHPMQTQQQMVRELFESERLQRCLALAPDPAAFLAEYHQELAREYLRIFIAGDNSHIPRVFGISLRGSMARYLALPCRDVISNILSSPYLSKQEADSLAKTFYKGFYQFHQGEIAQLDKLLGPQILALLRS